jgi:hypothetical protein
VTIDEEIDRLEDGIRRLKVEYEIYFSGGCPRTPHDTVYRVEYLIKKYSSDVSKLSFGQRFKFTQLVQRYTVNNELWRKRLRDKEEGRGQFGKLRKEVEAPPPDQDVVVVCSDPQKETAKVRQLFHALIAAKKRVGETADNLDPVAFTKFVQAQTQRVRESLACSKVQFSVSVEDGKVKFRATRSA